MTRVVHRWFKNIKSYYYFAAFQPVTMGIFVPSTKTVCIYVFLYCFQFFFTIFLTGIDDRVYDPVHILVLTYAFRALD